MRRFFRKAKSSYDKVNRSQTVLAVPFCVTIIVTILCRNDKLSSTMTLIGCLLTDSGLVKRMEITEILRRVWLFAAFKIKSSESFRKQPTQLIIAANDCHKHYK